MHEYIRFRLMRSPDGAWGIRKENGSWNGMIGQILRNVSTFIIIIIYVVRFKLQIPKNIIVLSAYQMIMTQI